VACHDDLDLSSVSRTIFAIEAELGVRLFHRTTRRMTLSEAGEIYLARIEGFAEELDRARGAASGELLGLSALMAPVTFGQMRIAATCWRVTEPVRWPPGRRSATARSTRAATSSALGRGWVRNSHVIVRVQEDECIPRVGPSPASCRPPTCWLGDVEPIMRGPGCGWHLIAAPFCIDQSKAHDNCASERGHVQSPS
jgi:DNA-binding transcriptional LysR family regulator